MYLSSCLVVVVAFKYVNLFRDKVFKQYILNSFCIEHSPTTCELRARMLT